MGGGGGGVVGWWGWVVFWAGVLIMFDFISIFDGAVLLDVSGEAGGGGGVTSGAFDSLVGSPFIATLYS